MTHSEHLAEAERIHAALVLRAQELESANAALSAKVATQANEIAALKTRVSALEAEIATLKARIAELEGQPTTPPVTPPVTQPVTPPPITVPPPPSSENWILHETFQLPLDPKRYIYLCHDPAQNFKWVSPGNFDVIFVAGKTSGPFSSVDPSTGKVLRSEVLWRKLGETSGGVPQGIATSKGYVLLVDLTIPADYDPSVSGSTNEKRNVFQLWESSSAKPFALELIRTSLPTSTPPGDGKTDFLRLVVGGSIRWWSKVVRGTRYRLRIETFLHSSTGKLRVTMNGVTSPLFTGKTCSGAAQMVPHWGLYLPASATDPVGGKTTMRFHEVGIADA